MSFGTKGCMYNCGDSCTGECINTASNDELTIPPTNSITFTLGNNPIIVINEEGFRYKGELIEDAGEVYELFKEYLKNAK
jgi:hypothetical protein